MNKIGSTALAHAARFAGVPVYVLADGTKMLPVGFPQILDDDRPPFEVWDAPATIRVWNRYFEVTPMDSVTSIVTEHGILYPDEVHALRASMEVPAGVKAWALARSRDSGG